MGTKKEISAEILADRAQYTPMIRQYLSFKDQYQDALIFYRIGDFYEMFFQDALVASRELEIVLTGKDAGVDERVPMCGIPFHAAESYIDKLTSRGYKVVVIEQMDLNPEDKGLVKRDVVKIVTPGTSFSDSLLDNKNNNYLSSIYADKEYLILAYMDVLTGDSYVETLPKDSVILKMECLKIQTKEIIVPDDFPKNISLDFMNVYGMVKSQEEDKPLPSYLNTHISNLNHMELKAIVPLLNYIVDTQKKALLNLKTFERVNPDSFLRMDYNTRKNLELLESIRSSSRVNTLASCLDKCATAMGSRMLRKSISYPLKDKEAIIRRQNIIETLKKNYVQSQNINELLRNVYDLERLTGKIAYESANPKDLLQLKKSLSIIPSLKKILVKTNLNNDFNLDKDYQTYLTIFSLINKAIDDNAPFALKEGHIIKDGYDPDIDHYRSLAEHSEQFLADLEEREKNRTGIKTLKIGYNNTFGYYIEVSKGALDQVKDEYGYIRKQTLTTGERYITQELKEHESEILTAKERLQAREIELFNEVRNTIKPLISEIQVLAKMLSELDMLCGLAKIASERHYVKPMINDNQEMIIKAGRHPMMECYRDDYIPNDVEFSQNKNILLITGPNMSGKSTYMRMMALIIIMTQMGSFVPATEAKMPIYDAIFTRIGASDDIVSGDSTFMVEMKDVEYALNQGTQHSFMVFDEIGRGTATYDGMALAQAIIEYIAHSVKANTIFSTHYHELTSLEEHLECLKNVHVSAKDIKGEIVFLHKVENGPAYQSYGIEVAKLAHLPLEVIMRASDILQRLESNQGANQANLNPEMYVAPMLYDSKTELETYILDTLKETDVNTLTPMAALQLLAELTDKANK